MIVSTNDILVTLALLKRRPRQVILEVCDKFPSIRNYPPTISVKKADEFQQAVRAYHTFDREERRYNAIANY